MKYKKTKHNKSLEYRLFPYLMILPNLLIFLVFIIIPFFYGTVISFADWKGIGKINFIGFGNYIELFSDSGFWSSLLRTTKFALCSLPFIIILPLFLAVMLTKKLRGKGIFRTIFYWPSMISYIVVGIAFRFIFGDSTGVISYFLQMFGLPKFSVMTNPTGAFWILILANLWFSTGSTMVIFMSGITNISPTYYEAAEVDGATSRQQFLKITLPLLKPTLFLVLILSLIGLFKAYGMVMQLTSGGPGDATKFVVQNIYDTAFKRFRLVYASAQSLVTTLILAVLTVLQFKANKGGEINDK